MREKAETQKLACRWQLTADRSGISMSNVCWIGSLEF